MNTRLVFALLTLLSACVDPGTVAVQGEVEVVGSGNATFTARDGVDVTLTRAELAFGPLYLCPGNVAGDLCETARGEMLEVVVIDLLNTTPARAATFDAVDATTRSAMWDYGTSFWLPDAAPTETQPTLVIEGVAMTPSGERAFEETIQIAPQRAGIHLVRASTLFEHEIRNGDVLQVSADAENILDGANFATPFVERDVTAIRNALTTSARPTLLFNP